MNASPPSSPPPSPSLATRRRQGMTIAGAVAIGVALGGFHAGIAEPVIPARAAPRSDRVAAAAPPAPRYSAIDAAAVGPNRHWSSSWAALKQNRPGLFDPVVRTSEMKEAALQDRLHTRAFEGAPPVIPHPVEQQSAATCLACHGDGLKLGEKLATKVSHPHYTNCLQCHVEQAGGLLTTADAMTPAWSANEFAGLLRSGPGMRAMPGAPPTIPHPLQLRGDCMSCHGLVARPGLRTTHPWLQNCRQCHVADEAAERPRFAEVLPATDATP